MKTLGVEDRLEYARAAIAVIRKLKSSNSKMRYGDLAKAIGLWRDGEPWAPWHRNQISDVLYLAAAANRQRRPVVPLEFERIVDSKGKPGKGFWKKARIVKK